MLIFVVLGDSISICLICSEVISCYFKDLGFGGFWLRKLWLGCGDPCLTGDQYSLEAFAVFVQLPTIPEKIWSTGC